MKPNNLLLKWYGSKITHRICTSSNSWSDFTSSDVYQGDEHTQILSLIYVKLFLGMILWKVSALSWVSPGLGTTPRSKVHPVYRTCLRDFSTSREYRTWLSSLGVPPLWGSLSAFFEAYGTRTGSPHSQTLNFCLKQCVRYRRAIGSISRQHECITCTAPHLHLLGYSRICRLRPRLSKSTSGHTEIVVPWSGTFCTPVQCLFHAHYDCSVSVPVFLYFGFPFNLQCAPTHNILRDPK